MLKINLRGSLVGGAGVGGAGVGGAGVGGAGVGGAGVGGASGAQPAPAIRAKANITASDVEINNGNLFLCTLTPFLSILICRDYTLQGRSG